MVFYWIGEFQALHGGRLGLERDEADLETKPGKAEGAGVGGVEVKVVLSLNVPPREYTHVDTRFRTLRLALPGDRNFLMKST